MLASYPLLMLFCKHLVTEFFIDYLYIAFFREKPFTYAVDRKLLDAFFLAVNIQQHIIPCQKRTLAPFFI